MVHIRNWIVNAHRTFGNWNAPDASGSVMNAQAIITQACSDLPGGMTSKTNRVLAETAIALHKRLGLPIYAQGEVACHLLELGIPVAGKTLRQIDSPEYLDTGAIARQQFVQCAEYQRKRVVVIAFVPHVWRAARAYKKAGFEVIIPEHLPACCWEPDAAQRQWRRPFYGIPYEFAARHRDLLLGNI
ncbi:MAG: hypothetical protein WA021_04930 [Minisyncoccia bacterium]